MQYALWIVVQYDIVATRITLQIYTFPFGQPLDRLLVYSVFSIDLKAVEQLDYECVIPFRRSLIILCDM